MEEKLWQLYQSCFPDNIRAEKTVRKVLALPGNQIFAENAGERLLGAAVLNGNTVLMLGVLPGSRCQGIGSRLLEQSEEQVRKAGYAEIQFCDGPDYLTPGIPLTGDNEAFFKKRGYIHSWGDGECVDMAMDLADFPPGEGSLGDTLDGVTYRWAREEDREAVVGCVERAYPEFAGYYRDRAQYDGAGPERVLMAAADGAVCGALLVGCETEAKGVGSVGCTVTAEEYRCRGIATRMVRLGTGYLRAQGLARGFLGYTYTDIVPMYARSGYQVCKKYLMGKKKLI